MAHTSLYKGAIKINFGSQPIVWRWTRGGGAAVQFESKGKFATLLSDAGTLMEDYDSITIEKINGEGDFYKLSAAQSDSAITEIHAVVPGNLTQSVLINLVMKAQFLAGGMSEGSYSESVSKIAAEVARYKANLKTYAEMVTAVTAVSGLTLAQTLMKDLDLNGDQFLQAQYTYVHTLIIPERIYLADGNPYTDIYDDTHKIFTETYLRANEDIPDDFALPPRVVDGDPAEWLKQGTASDLTFGQKRQVVKTYLFSDEWSRLKYAEYTP